MLHGLYFTWDFGICLLLNHETITLTKREKTFNYFDYCMLGWNDVDVRIRSPLLHRYLKRPQSNADLPLNKTENQMSDGHLTFKCLKQRNLAQFKFLGLNVWGME